MEDEIDLHQYICVLVRRWKWIVGLTATAALVAAAVSFIVPPTYEATSLVYVLPASSTVGSQTLLTPQTQLAILQCQAVAQRTVDSLGTKLTPDEKRALLCGESVRVSADPTDKSLFKMTAQANTAEKAIDIANALAYIGADELNQRQIQSLSRPISTIQQKADDNAKDLQKAEENLQRRQRELQVDLVNQELGRTLQILSGQTTEREHTKSALAQAQALRVQVQQGQISLSAEMLLNLQITATASENSLLIQPEQFVSLGKPQQTERLDAVIAALAGRLQGLSASIDTAATQATSLQQQLNDKQAALIEPTRLRDTARSNYDSATAQLRDAQTRMATGQNLARAIPATIPPDSPVAPKKMQNIAVGGALGLLMSVLGVFAVEYFGTLRSTQTRK